MDSHRVKILNGADDDYVVSIVAHYLKLEFLPPDYRLFKHDLVDEAGV